MSFYFSAPMWKNLAANQRLQYEVSCWLCFLGQKGGGHKCIQNQYYLPGEKKRDSKDHMCAYTCKCALIYFLLIKCVLVGQTLKILHQTTWAPLAARLKTSSIMSLFYQFTILNLEGGRDFQAWLSIVEGRNIFVDEGWDFQAFIKSVLRKTLK